jgi:hypothetical protein
MSSNKMLKFVGKEEKGESAFMCEMESIDDILSKDEYKKFRSENKEWIREQLTKKIEKRMKELRIGQKDDDIKK